MTNELLINGTDAYTMWGVILEDGSKDKFDIAAPIKDFPENKSETTHGKSVMMSAPKYDERELTVVFCFVSRPNVSKGTLGTGGTVADNTAFIALTPVIGDYYTVITAATYGKTGHTVVCFIADVLLYTGQDVWVKYTLGVNDLHDNFMYRKKDFLTTLQNGKLTGSDYSPLEINVVELLTTYKVIYQTHISMTSAKYIGKAAVKFVEPDPSQRI
jgi:hypothetical protein